MLRDDAYLYDILESARAALEYMRGKTWDDFSKDSMLQDAVARRLEIIGEASGRVSNEIQKKHSHLPWQAMKGLVTRLSMNTTLLNSILFGILSSKIYLTSLLNLRK